jgi:hypothetical protein
MSDNTSDMLDSSDNDSERVWESRYSHLYIDVDAYGMFADVELLFGSTAELILENGWKKTDTFGYAGELCFLGLLNGKNVYLQSTEKLGFIRAVHHNGDLIQKHDAEHIVSKKKRAMSSLVASRALKEIGVTKVWIQVFLGHYYFL